MKQLEKLLIFQKNEISEYFIYQKLAYLVKDNFLKEALLKIAHEEKNHYEFLKSFTKKEISPSRFKIFFYFLIAKIFGLNFGLKLMEKKEAIAFSNYTNLKNNFSFLEKIIEEEEKHENILITALKEERLLYVSSMVLGLNDALVELSGALIGFSFALQNTKLVAMVGLITGISASLSMASSEFLSTKHEEGEKKPLKASLYTGFAYIITVIILIFPYFLFKNIFFSVFLLVLNVVFLIFIFNFYIAVAKDLNFKKRFLEMFLITSGVALINFFLGFFIRNFFGL